MSTSAGLSDSARVNFWEAVLLTSSKVLVHPPAFLHRPTSMHRETFFLISLLQLRMTWAICHISPKVSLTPDQAYHFELFWDKDPTVKCIQCWTLGNPSNICEALCGLALGFEWVLHPRPTLVNTGHLLDTYTSCWYILPADLCVNGWQGRTSCRVVTRHSRFLGKPIASTGGYFWNCLVFSISANA